MMNGLPLPREHHVHMQTSQRRPTARNIFRVRGTERAEILHRLILGLLHADFFLSSSAILKMEAKNSSETSVMWCFYEGVNAPVFWDVRPFIMARGYQTTRCLILVNLNLGYTGVLHWAHNMFPFSNTEAPELTMYFIVLTYVPSALAVY